MSVPSMFQDFCHRFFVELTLLGTTTWTHKIVGNVSPKSSGLHVAFVFAGFLLVDVLANSTFPFIH